jgi:hypothetical protein
MLSNLFLCIEASNELRVLESKRAKKKKNLLLLDAIYNARQRLMISPIQNT